MPEEPVNSAPKTPTKKVPKAKRAWLGIVLVLALAAAGAFVWWGTQPSTSAAEGATEPTLSLETFVVNLEGSGQRAYLRVGITLGLSHPVAQRNGDAAPVALVRDTILAVLATGQPEELLKVEGKRQLKDQLLKALQEKAPQIGVENVYFTEFLVQM